jgi:N-acetylglutamate synthase-like GNAT family acetyltransferase
MKLTDSVQFDHEDRRELYKYVERRGTVHRDELLVGDVHEQRAIGHQLAILKRNGYIGENGAGELSIDIDTDAAQTFEEDDVEFDVRQARQKDLSGIVGTIRQVADERTYIVAENVANVLDQEDVLLRHNEVESRIFFVATVNDEVVGWVHLTVPELEKLQHTAELTLGVIEDYRGHGIGGHLLERGLGWAKEHGFEKVYQSIPSTNEDAIEFIEAHGGEVESVREDHYKVDGEYVDEVMMAIEV